MHSGPDSILYHSINSINHFFNQQIIPCLLLKYGDLCLASRLKSEELGCECLFRFTTSQPKLLDRFQDNSIQYSLSYISMSDSADFLYFHASCLFPWVCFSQLQQMTHPLFAKYVYNFSCFFLLSSVSIRIEEWAAGLLLSWHFLPIHQQQTAAISMN